MSTNVAVSPLAPHDRRLRRGRYEVNAFGPKDPQTTARRLLAGPHRFATLADAEAFAATIDGDVVCVDRVAPESARHPEGPWRTTRIATLDGGER